MKVIEPLTITESEIVDLNLFDTPPPVWEGGTIYALGEYASVEQALGELLIYQSLGVGNFGNTPSSSPTWWKYNSKAYNSWTQRQRVIGFSPPNTIPYQSGHTVRDSSSGYLYESLFSDNTSILDPVNDPIWSYVGTITSPLDIGVYSAAVTYVFQSWVRVDVTAPSNPEEVVSSTVYLSKQNNNINHAVTDTTWWEVVPNYPLPWSYTKVYALGDVAYKEDNTIWYSLRGGNQNNIPATTTHAWLKLQPSNRKAMFDNLSSTTSTANSVISVTLKTGIIDTVGLINLNATGVNVIVRNGLGGTIVYTKTASLVNDSPTNAWEYYFGEIGSLLTQYVLTDIPPITDCYVTIEVTGGSETSVGNLIIGRSKDLGISIYGAQAGILDFSTKTTDTFGKTTFTKKGYKKTLNIQTEVEKLKINTVQRKLYGIRATPCLWVSTSDIDLSEPLVLYGYYKDFSTDISYPTHSLCSLEIEGLT
jgi:hypothetical protein